MIEAANQAMNALDAYWAKHEMPDPQEIAQIYQRLEAHAAGCEDDWTTLLDAAMSDLGYRIEWRGEDVLAIARSGG